MIVTGLPCDYIVMHSDVHWQVNIVLSLIGLAEWAYASPPCHNDLHCSVRECSPEKDTKRDQGIRPYRASRKLKQKAEQG